VDVVPRLTVLRRARARVADVAVSCDVLCTSRMLVGETVLPLSVSAVSESGTLRAHRELFGDLATPFPLPEWATEKAAKISADLCERQAS
jgi:hypothetical protein